MRKHFVYLMILFGSVILWYGCVPEAPHSNPLDGIDTGATDSLTLAGAVFTRFQPVQPLENSEVKLLPDGLVRLTSPEGMYRFENLRPGNYRVVAEKADYLPDTLEVALKDAASAQEVNFFLDALPVIARVRFYSEHIDQWWPGEIYHAIFSLVVADPDGSADIDSLVFSVPQLNISQALQATSRADSFSIEIENFDLPGGTLQLLVENDSWLTVTDQAGAIVRGGPYFLRRIIDPAPIPQSPVDLQTAPAFPVLEWQPFTLPFSFTFEARVFRINAGVPVLIHISPPIDPALFTYTVPDSLGSGSYFWTIGVRDNLSNYSRSKEASFIVP